MEKVCGEFIFLIIVSLSVSRHRRYFLTGIIIFTVYFALLYENECDNIFGSP
jgi:hypothetical protein